MSNPRESDFCPHDATVTTPAPPLYAAFGYGPVEIINPDDADPVTTCVTCGATIDLEETP